jgi:cell division transport system permease protein
MSLRSLEHAVCESVIGIRRNGLMSMASITTIGLSFAVLGAFVLLILGLNNVAQSLLKEFEIGVFLTQDTTEDDVSELRMLIRALPHVQTVEFISKEAAWEKVKADLSDQIQLSGVEENPLPHKFCVKLDHPRYTIQVASAIRKMDRVDEVVEARQIVVKVVGFADLVKLIGGLAAGGLFLVTAFIISNTIRLTVYARRKEISIMQLVGASNWFIRLPLVFEGIILGAIGGGIACLLIFGGAHYIKQTVIKVLPLLGQYSSDVEPLYFFGGLVALGCLTGATGSLISIRRFLRA